VLDALAHRQPERVPFSWGFGPTAEMGATLTRELATRGLSWPALREAVEDVRWVGPAYLGPQRPAGTDAWGIRRAAQGYGGGQYDEIIVNPLAGVEDIATLEAYPWTDAECFDYPGLRARILEGDPARRRATKIGGGNVFEIYCWMTGLEEALTNLLVCPELVSFALMKITDHCETCLRHSLTAAGDLVDLVFLADDLGSQTGLLLSREHYRNIIQPSHRRLTAAVRECAPHATVMFHSDGAVFDILPDLLDAGVQMLEAVQTDAAGMDPVRLKSTFGDRLGYHGAISVQHLLPHGTPDTVKAECHHLIAALGRNGGYIAAPAHAIQLGTPVENVLAMLQAVLGEDDYQAGLSAARLPK
jgi:uroporphyrinogen decarboxylase